VHDLAERLMDEARVVQSGDAEVRLVQCVAPGPDPLFFVAIVMPITRDGRLDRRRSGLRARPPCPDPLDVVMRVLRGYRWPKNDGRKSQQARRGRRDCTAPRPKSGAEIDAVRRVTTKFREGWRQ
jgi:hypothetical protein